MNWQQLHDLYADGHEIGGHTLDHLDLTELTRSGQRRQVCEDREALRDRGFSVASFAYPYGKHDSTSQDIVRECGYKSARGAGGVGEPGPYSESSPPRNPFATRTTGEDTAEPLQLHMLQKYVTDAENHGGGWVQIIFHDVCDGCDGYSPISVQTLDAFLSWLEPRAARGTVMRTVQEVIAAPTTPMQATTATYFATLRPGSLLPGDDECARSIRTTWREHRPENEPYNRVRGYRIGYLDGANEEGQWTLASRINGDFTGKTDEIIQWASCKWGFDEDIVRSVAVVESNWYQHTIGDAGQSHGILQVKCTVHKGACPAAANSTAFNLDYALAWRRACFEGYFDWLPSEARGDEWGCVGLWYSGEWKQANSEYLQSVRKHLNERPWLQEDF